MSREVLLDLSFLNENERDLITGVISKDAEVRKAEQIRISNLRKGLDQIKENGLPEDELESKNENYCARCQTYFGFIFNRGAYCPRCEQKVCKVCRVNDVDDSWICILCNKVREVKAQSGAWFFQGHKEKNGRLFGSMLVRQSLRRLPLKAQKDSEEQSNPFVEKDEPKSLKNGHQRNDYHYSDESDLDSEERSHDGSYHDTASDRTLSKDIEGHHMPAEYEEEENAGADPAGSESDEQKCKDEREMLEDVQPEITTANQDTKPEPYSFEANAVQPVNHKDTTNEDPMNVLRAFSESFVTTNLGLKEQESHEDRDAHKDSEEQKDREYRAYQHSPKEDDAYEDRGYHAGQYFPEEPDDRYSDSEGPNSRRSSDLHHEGFHADNESMISETSGYGTPSASEDTSSKQTPSISGDDRMSTPREEARRPYPESAPMIVTTEIDDDPRHNNNPRESSITEYEDDLDVSFSKYGAGLGNRKLKDQLSLGSRESIASYYSNAGGEVYGKYPVSGEIFFGIKYDAKIQEFQIQVHKAREITAVDKKSKTSDPYVKTYLLPDRTRTGKRKSKVKKHTINPVFDEILTYKITYDDLLQRTLWLAIWNHDSFGHNDFLGEVLLPIDEYQLSGYNLEDPDPQWYDLHERQAEDPQFSYNGEIVFALKYVPPSATKKKKKKKKTEEEKGELHVNIIQASNLLAKDSNGFSDPFCKSYLLPDKSKKTKQKTPVVKKNLNPKWNYQFVYDNVTHEELMDRVLELTIWDYDRGSSNEFLGGVRLGLGTGVQEWDDATSEEQAAWNKMLNNQNTWNQASLTLRDHMGSHK